MRSIHKFGVWKRWGNKTCRSTSNKQNLPSWFVKKWTSWRCEIGLNILLPTAVPVVCLSYCRLQGLEYHNYITLSDHTKCVIPHFHTFGLLSQNGRLGGGGLRRKSPLDGATDLLSEIWQHITTVSFVSAFIDVCSRKPKNASGRVQMGPKHNLVHFKSLSGCLLIKSWSSSHHLYAGKTWRVIPSLPSHLVFHFTLVKGFRFGWQDWWGHSGISLLKIEKSTAKICFQLKNTVEMVYKKDDTEYITFNTLQHCEILALFDAFLAILIHI